MSDALNSDALKTEEGRPSKMGGSSLSRRRRIGLQFLPFVMSAGLFISAFFTAFAPIPLLLVGLARGYRWSLAAVLTNAAIVYFVLGSGLFEVYAVGVLIVALALPYFLRHRKLGLEATLGWTWGVQVLTAVALLSVHAALHGVSPWQELQNLLGAVLDQMVLNPETRKQLLGDLSPAEWKAQALIDVPMTLMAISLFMVFVNLNLLITLMGRTLRAELGLNRKSFHAWKNAEWLIWPVILFWGAWLAAQYFKLPDQVAPISLGLLKIVLALYGIQGIAILGSYFDAWKVKGLLRLGLFFFALFLVLPLVVSIGFFDLWFDFRARIRQS